MLIGAPALLVPLATLLILQSGATPLTPVELAVSELPIAGPAIVPGSDAASPFGTNGERLSVTHSMPLQAGSARFATARLTLRESEGAVRGGDANYMQTGYALLHPDRLADDNFLLGDIWLMSRNPADAQIGAQLFAEYCAARPDDPFYNADVRSLPIGESSLQLALSWSALPGTSGHCPVRPG